MGGVTGNSDNIPELFEKYKNDIKFEILPGGMWVGWKTYEDTATKWSVVLSACHDTAVEEHTE